MKQSEIRARYPAPKRRSSPRVLAVLVILALAILGGFFLVKRAQTRKETLFAEARAAYESERYEEATTRLHDFLSRYDASRYSSEARYYLASSHQALGEHDAAVPVWRKLLDDTSLLPERQQQVAFNLGICLERTGDSVGAMEAYRRAAQYAEGQLAAAAWLRVAELMEQEGKVDEAADAYREAANRYPETVEGKEAGTRLSAITLPYVLRANAETYHVKRGDTLAIIARKMESSVGQIMLANGLTNPRIRIGDRLLIPKVRFQIDIGLEDRVALLKVNGQIVKRYPVGIGAPETPTPPGDFQIINKLDKPSWRNPEGALIPYGDPSNELGTRWLGIASAEIPASRGFGLHGTIDPASIGQAVSNGCLRFYNADIEELFDLVEVGTPVRIGPHTHPAPWYEW